MHAPNKQVAQLSMNPTAQPPTASKTVDKAVDLTETVAAIVKEVAEVLQHAPYVKTLSGVILQFIKIRNELKMNKERCEEIIDKVLNLSHWVYDKLAAIAKSGERVKENLAQIEKSLNLCARTLKDVADELEKHQSRSKLAKFISRGLEDLNKLDRSVDNLEKQLVRDIVFDIKLQQSAPARVEYTDPRSDLTAGDHDHILPPKPHLMVEREDQLKITLSVLLRAEPSCIAIVGGGGFGKTTLARTILHDPNIIERYQSRHFLSCEGMPGADTLLLGFGAMLGIKAAPSAILTSARHMLGTSTTLLCFDNFETPWEPFDTRTKVEELLETIADIPNLSLIITMRGEQRPSKVAWSIPLLPPLSTLSPDSAMSVLQNIAGSHTINDCTLNLLKATDGIPLAITLVSTLLRDGESSESLWRRWSMNHTQVLHTGGDDRQSNLNRSIYLSVYSLRMNKDGDVSRQLLAALSLLPDGFPFDMDALTSLQEYLNGVVDSDIPIHRPKFGIFRTILKRGTRVRANQQNRERSLAAHGPNIQIDDIHSLIQTLRTVALIGVDETSTSPRIQMLSPIRLFCLEFLLSDTLLLLGKIVDYYISVMLDAEDKQDNLAIYNRVVPEIQNIHSIFQRVYKLGYSQDISSLIDATTVLSAWSNYIGYLSKDTVLMALEQSNNLPILRAKCLLSLGQLYDTEGLRARAEKCFRDAAELFNRENDAKNEAWALWYLGDLLRFMQQLDQAEVILKASLELYTQASDKTGQANVGKSLGNVYLSKDQYSEAEGTLTIALQAYKQIPDFLGQANAAYGLARLYTSCGNLDDAEKFATEALTTAKQVKYAVGEGNALGQLGKIYLRTDKVTDAGQVLEQALKIAKQQNDIHNLLGAADDLAKVYIQLDQLSAVEALLTEFARMELDIIRILIILVTLACAYICGDHLDKAEPHLDRALKLFRKFEDRAWQAEVLSRLGELYLKSDRLDNAEQVLKSIPDLGAWRDVDMHRLWVLGDLYIIKGKLDDAETLFNEAMVNAKDWPSSYQQGNIVRSMGTLHIKRGRIDRAIRAFKRAREFHCKAQCVSEQATDLRRLSEAYEMQGMSQEAKAAFEEADALFESVRESRTMKL